MNPITHLLASWTVGEASRLEDDRDRALVAWAGAAPDLDGLGAVADVAARALGWGDPGLYARFHHVLLHGLPGALFLAAGAMALARRRWRVFGWAVLAVHIHLVCDVLGSRGPERGDFWPVHYLAPVSDALTVSWRGQWRLDAWPNLAFTGLLIAFVFVRAATAGRSPVSLVSRRGNEAFVRAVRRRE
ncbi:MAG: metal-dependent hydrolase [Planctomycetota bacterium]